MLMSGPSTRSQNNEAPQVPQKPRRTPGEEPYQRRPAVLDQLERRLGAAV